MRTYTSYGFYKDQFTGLAEIPDKKFPYWAMQATALIRRSTFGRVDGMEEIPEDVQMCCCEVAEKLYTAESAKDENGLILQSYGNDGETGTYKTDELSESAVGRSVSRIIRKWLVHTGLMYLGAE